MFKKALIAGAILAATVFSTSSIAMQQTCEWWPGEGIFCCSGNHCGFVGESN